MKKTIRLVSLLMALLLCAAVFVSCGDAGKQGETTTTASVEQSVNPASTEPQFPTASYNGDTFTVYAREAGTYSHSGIYAEEQTGDVINDQTLSRNQAVEAKYNIKFALKTAESPYKTLEADLQSDSVDYDILLDERQSFKNSITSGFLQNWHNTALDMTTSWWDANCVKGYDINGKLYMAVCDVSTANLSGARFLYYNKSLITDYHLESPYDLVDNNGWVLDKFIEMVKAISQPSVDGGVGVFGMLRETGASNGNHMHLMTGCGISMIKWEDGKMVSNVDTSMIEKMQNITDKLKTVLNSTYTLTYDEVNTLDKDHDEPSKWTKARMNFAEGHFLFVQNGMGVADLFQDMKDGFGVVPNPKYNSDQTEYYHMVDRYALIWAIPNSASVDLERLATIMDFWAYSSTNTVMSAFYEVVTKGKRAQDPIAGKNLDIVKNSIQCEIAYIFDVGMTSALDEGYSNGNISAKFANNAAMKIKIDQVNTSLEALE